MSQSFWRYKAQTLQGIRMFLRIARIKRPEGTLLLLWPCLWGYLYNARVLHWSAIAWCIGGALWMRSVGCVYNDWVDHRFDRYVERTQDRLQLMEHSLWRLPYVYICMIGTILALLTLPFRVMLWGACGWLFSLLYPWTKRYVTPQYFLGSLFAWGVWVGSAMAGTVSMPQCLYLYMIAILWTIEYDSVYSAPDYKDDQKLGLKSMATAYGDRLYNMLIKVILLRGVFMSFFAWPSFTWIKFVPFLCFLSYSMLARVSFQDPTSCQHYFRFQAWIYGPVMTCWVYACLY